MFSYRIVMLYFLLEDFYVSSYYAFVDNHRQIPLYKQDI